MINIKHSKTQTNTILNINNIDVASTSGTITRKSTPTTSAGTTNISDDTITTNDFKSYIC